MQENHEDINKTEFYQTDIDLDAKYQEDVSRTKLLRLFWYIPQYFIITIWSIFVYFILIFYLFNILLMQERHEWSWNFIMRFTRHVVKWHAYMFLFTDKMPKIIED